MADWKEITSEQRFIVGQGHATQRNGKCANPLADVLHRMARYLFENDSGSIDLDFCRCEMKDGRCPFRGHAYAKGIKIRDPDVCADCLVRIFKENKKL